jgi:DNA invertase Pin-like site-specific DNA recombinase
VVAEKVTRMTSIMAADTRVSTDEQDTFAQLDALRAEGCLVILEDKASGGSRDRPNLAKALQRVGQGDTLLVVRIDRLARSLSHLLEIVETLRAKRAYFRSINDPIDTASAQGMLMTQMLGAFAEFERALIRERTRAGLKGSGCAWRQAGKSENACPRSGGD